MPAASQYADPVDRRKRHHHLEQPGEMVPVVVGAHKLLGVVQGLSKRPQSLHDCQADKWHAGSPPAPHRVPRDLANKQEDEHTPRDAGQVQ